MVPEGDKEPHKQEVEQSEAARLEAQTRVEQEAAQAQACKEVEAGTLDNDALGELLEVARDQARAEVEVRSALNSRAGWLLGFAGVILTLSGAQAQKVLNELRRSAKLIDRWRWPSSLWLWLPSELPQYAHCRSCDYALPFRSQTRN